MGVGAGGGGVSRIMLFQLSLLLTSFRYFRVPFPRILVRPFCWAFYFCRSFSPLLTLPLRRRLTYPPFYRWIFCLLTVRFFRLHLRNAPGCGFSWSCPRTWVGLRKKKRKKKRRRKKPGIFRRSRVCHDSLLQPALSPRNPVVGVHIEGLAQPVALHNRLSRPVGQLRTLP